MNDRFTSNTRSVALLLSFCILAAGCSDSANTAAGNREAVIESNISRRKSVDGEEYENALLPFEQVTNDDVKYLADHHPRIRQVILGPLHADSFEKWKSVEQLTDESLRHIGRLHELESVNALAGSSITDEGLAHLSGLTRLHSLDLRRTSITGEGLSHLRHLEDLDRLWLPSSLTQEGIETVGTLQHVRVLSIYCNQDFSPLSQMESLDRLEIFGVESGTDYSWLPKLGNCDELSVWTKNEDVIRGFPFIGQMDRLLRLSIALPTTDEEIRPFAGCERLEAIYFKDSSQLTPDAVKTFVEMPRLENLRLHDCRKELILALTPLADKRTLHSLSLTRSPLDDEVLPILSQFRNLKYLGLIGTQISESGCRKLYNDLEGRCVIQPSKGPTLGK